MPGKFAAVKRVLPVLAEDADSLSHCGRELDNLAPLPAGANTKLLASDRPAKPPWFATEFIPGVALNEAVRLHGGSLLVESLWRLLRHAAEGLRVVHGAEMVHRDLKPSNVMLTGDRLSLIGFGVARAADQSRLTKTGMGIGTPACMAPEQAVADRQLTGAAHVLAPGSLVLYAANGRPPFGDGSGPDLLYQVVHGEPDFGQLTDADPELTALLRRCFAEDPATGPPPPISSSSPRSAPPGPSGPPPSANASASAPRSPPRQGVGRGRKRLGSVRVPYSSQRQPDRPPSSLAGIRSARQ
ncbi:protein kinase [Streptomyces sp. NPDC006553]|uniref:protein kinase domain-containing protein n=1 Tax=unclassified Streptomyces TaxID=2593676 RepID=UPI00225472E2|nr:protein kinase [Streptomyces sp. NBC_00233]MCX5232786.1 protein kinase [Streptomyces sp. NBC_00233]